MCNILKYRSSTLPWIVSERHTVKGRKIFWDAGPCSWICRKALVWSHHTIDHWHPWKHGITYTHDLRGELDA